MFLSKRRSADKSMDMNLVNSVKGSLSNVYDDSDLSTSTITDNDQLPADFRHNKGNNGLGQEAGGIEAVVDEDGSYGSWSSEEMSQAMIGKRAFQRSFKFQLNAHCYTPQSSCIISRSVRANLTAKFVSLHRYISYYGNQPVSWFIFYFSTTASAAVHREHRLQACCSRLLHGHVLVKLEDIGRRKHTRPRGPSCPSRISVLRRCPTRQNRQPLAALSGD